MRIGVTGHMDLSERTAQLVRAAVDATLRELDGDLTGVTCLAFGADRIFARSMLDAGGALEVILPAADYRERLVWAEHLPVFDGLLAGAVKVEVMPFAESGAAAYAAANERMLRGVDALLAVWDGEPAANRGGTADAVAAAGRLGVPVTVIWPEGAQREN